MNTVKSFTTIHLRLGQIDVLEAVTVSMTYLINMYSKQNRRFKSKHDQHDYRSKRIKNINKAYIMRM